MSEPSEPKPNTKTLTCSRVAPKQHGVDCPLVAGARAVGISAKLVLHGCHQRVQAGCLADEYAITKVAASSLVPAHFRTK